MKLPTVWAAIDVETADTFGADASGKRVLPSHLCSLACVVVVGGRIVERWSQLVRPTVPISPRATAIHGIDDAAVAEAQPFGAAHTRLRTTLSRHRVAALVAHNAPFDRAVLEAECDRAAMPRTTRPWVDTIDEAKALWPHLARPRGPGYGLGVLCAELGLEHQHHDALSDATACALIALAAQHLREAGGEHDMRLARAFCAGVTARGAWS